MNKFIGAIENEASLNGNLTYTENGAVARDTTGDALMDFYAVAGAMRPRSKEEIIEKFRVAWSENPPYALKCVFYTRDIRGGLGERRTARIILKWLAQNYPYTVAKNFDNLMEMGRADDFYEFVGTPVEPKMWDYLRGIIAEDIKNMKAEKPITLTAKWLKSINTSSKESRELGRKTAYAFGLTEREYRKTLSRLRNYLKVVETKMSAGEWTNIDYETVPSRAMKIYKNAFKRHNPSAFETYVDKVEKGEAKINASTLYPYDLVSEYLSGYEIRTDNLNRVIEAQWKALPNYIEGENNVLVMADVSGSMCGRPLCTSIGLAIYFAERNHGAFRNYYMTFSSDPAFIKINSSESLESKVNHVVTVGVGYSTDLEKAFMKVLDTCIMNQVPQSDVPKAIVVISDMEINRYLSGYGLDFVSEMAVRFRKAGYNMPKLIMWNVEARNNTFHADYQNPYVQFASGQSASTFKDVLAGITLNAYDSMMKVLNSERYASVII